MLNDHHGDLGMKRLRRRPHILYRDTTIRPRAGEEECADCSDIGNLRRALYIINLCRSGVCAVPLDGTYIIAFILPRRTATTRQRQAQEESGTFALTQTDEGQVAHRGGRGVLQGNSNN